MIGKILHGSGFAGLVDYVNDPRKGAKLVAASEGINLMENPARVDPLRRNAADPRKHFYFDPLKSPGRRVSFILDFTCSSAS